MANRSRRCTITLAIFGMRYVGLPLVLRFSEEGYRVIGFDIDQATVERLDRGESYVQHISAEAIANTGAAHGLDMPVRRAIAS